MAAVARYFRQELRPETAGSSDEHAYVTPDLFTAETPLGTYQGMTDQVALSEHPAPSGRCSCHGVEQTRMADAVKGK